MHPNQKLNFNDCYMKIDPPIWIAADFECMNVPLESTSENGVSQWEQFVCEQISCNGLKYSEKS